MSFAKRMLLVNEDYINMIRKHGNIHGSSSEENHLKGDETIVLTLPKTLRAKAEALIKYLRNNGVDYDDKHILTIDKVSIPGTNYADLIHDMVRFRETLPEPPGFDALAPVLKRLNVSRELITNMKRYNTIMALSTEEENLESPASLMANYGGENKRDDYSIRGEEEGTDFRFEPKCLQSKLRLAKRREKRSLRRPKPYSKSVKKIGWIRW